MKRQLRGPVQGPPRWMIAGVLATGVLVCLATLRYLWTLPFSQALTPDQEALVVAGALVAASLMALAVAMGVTRSRG